MGFSIEKMRIPSISKSSAFLSALKMDGCCKCGGRKNALLLIDLSKMELDLTCAIHIRHTNNFFKFSFGLNFFRHPSDSFIQRKCTTIAGNWNCRWVFLRRSGGKSRNRNKAESNPILSVLLILLNCAESKINKIPAIHLHACLQFKPFNKFQIPPIQARCNYIKLIHSSHHISAGELEPPFCAELSLFPSARISKTTDNNHTKFYLFHFFNSLFIKSIYQFFCLY